MTLTAALDSAISGLKAQSSALSAISANIANASTTGYKTVETSFDAMVTANSSAGAGVTASAYQNLSAQGEIASTSTSTNMAISGSGFFVVSQTAGATQTTDDLFTRDGSFTANANGNLVNSSGDYLLGYATDASGTPTASNAGTLGGLTAVTIPQTTSVSATTTASLAANLPADLAVGGSVTSSMTVVDALGVSQTVNETWTKTAANTWTLGLANPYSTDSSTSSGTISPSSVTVSFDSSGVLQSTNPSPATISLSGLTSGAADMSFTLNLGTAGKTDGLTQYASTDSSAAISITSSSQNGSSAGTFSSVSIGTDGLVTAKYSNGASIVVAKVPIATFADQEGLEQTSGSTYSASAASGTATLHTAGTDGSGTISGGALEDSTTDTATEFDKMIVAQQAYSAASQVITYTDKMYTTLIQAMG